MFSGKVIAKFMTAEELSAFIEKYMAHKGWARKSRPVTDEDRQILAEYKAGTSVKDLMKKYSRTESRINTSIIKAIKE